MKHSPLLVAALFTILVASITTSVAGEPEPPVTRESVSLSSHQFEALIDAAKALPLNRQSAPLQEAIETWAMIAYSVEKSSDDLSLRLSAEIYFEPSDEYGPKIECISDLGGIEWTDCSDATIDLNKGCT